MVIEGARKVIAGMWGGVKNLGGSNAPHSLAPYSGDPVMAENAKSVSVPLLAASSRRVIQLPSMCLSSTARAKLCSSKASSGCRPHPMIERTLLAAMWFPGALPNGMAGTGMSALWNMVRGEP